MTWRSGWAGQTGLQVATLEHLQSRLPAMAPPASYRRLLMRANGFGVRPPRPAVGPARDYPIRIAMICCDPPECDVGLEAEKLLTIVFSSTRVSLDVSAAAETAEPVPPRPDS